MNRFSSSLNYYRTPQERQEVGDWTQTLPPFLYRSVTGRSLAGERLQLGGPHLDRKDNVLCVLDHGILA